MAMYTLLLKKSELRSTIGRSPGFHPGKLSSTLGRSKKEHRKLTKKELIKELNRQNVGNDEEILISIIKESEINNKKAIPGLASIDFIGGRFINIKAM